MDKEAQSEKLLSILRGAAGRHMSSPALAKEMLRLTGEDLGQSKVYRLMGKMAPSKVVQDENKKWALAPSDILSKAIGRAPTQTDEVPGSRADMKVLAAADVYQRMVDALREQRPDTALAMSMKRAADGLMEGLW